MHEAHIHVTFSLNERGRVHEFFASHVRDVTEGYRGAEANLQEDGVTELRVNFSFPSADMNERFCRMERRALSLSLRHSDIEATWILCAGACGKER